MNLDRTGTFRIKLLEKVVGKTKNGFPQLVAKVVCTQLYDPNAEGEGKPGWFDVTEWDMQAVAYLCLYGKNRKTELMEPTFNKDHVMDVFEWDGASLAVLDQQDSTDLGFQIRVTENNYEGARAPFQIDSIAKYDADPVDSLRKLDAKQIKDLDAQFSTLTAASASKAASAPKSASHPARVPAGDKPTPKVPVAPKAPKAPAEEKPLTKAEQKKLRAERSQRIKDEAEKKAAPETPAVPETTASTPTCPEDVDAVESCTKKEAWARIFEMRDPTIDDGTVKELWDAAIEETAGPGVAHADIIGEQWWKVKDIVLADCGKF